MTVRLCGAAVAAASLALLAHAQDAPFNGIRPATVRLHAIVGAEVVVSPDQTLPRATIVMRDGVIEAVGPDVAVPAGARTWSGEGLRVYPGLIDAAVLVAADPPEPGPGAHWNDRVHPQLRLARYDEPADGVAESLRSIGFTAAAIYPSNGIFRGRGVVVALGENAEDSSAYLDPAPMAMGLDYGGGWQNATYPGSQMGAIALIRQTVADARWHADCRRLHAEDRDGREPPIRADALDALEDVVERGAPVLFEVDDELQALRADALGRELDLELTLLGSGMEFRRLDDIVATGRPLVIPLDYPERPDLSSLAKTEDTSLREMQTWEQAPTNPRRLIEAGATVALTTERLRSRSSFPAKLHDAIRHGLAEGDALAALTTVPAGMLGLDDVLGTIEPGKAANLVVVEGSLFEKKPKIRDVWVDGRRHEIDARPTVTVTGGGTLVTDRGDALPATVDTEKKKVTVEHDGKKLAAKKVLVQQDRVAFTLDAKAFGGEGWAQLSGVHVGEEIAGTGRLPGGETFAWSMAVEPKGPDAADEDAADDDDADDDETDDDDADDGTDEAGDDDPVAGRWVLDVTPVAAVESMDAVLVLERTGDGGVFGTARALGGEFEVSDGTFDAATGAIELTVTDPAGESAALRGTIREDDIEGTVRGPSIDATFTGRRDAPARSSRGGAGGKDEDAFEAPPETLVLPLGAAGVESMPAPRDVLVRNATIWTCGSDGIVENADLLVRNGRIERIGRRLAAADAQVIDATGKHVTPGLIDCHSHTGISGGVNEWTQANTAEVSIRDVVDPDDINWYRQLAGGLTASNLLHGSANPIGGGNAVVKLKWGGDAGDFLVDDAPPGIKFALGENVKRTEGRYPDTRMGVEAYIRDAFTAARAYRDAQAGSASAPYPPRPDLELETLLEILDGERLVHCHSYRQDEILMLIRVADDFGFTIGTFQHVLEGYKVADAIAAHGAGASSFSDWWAYKMEVMDAVPHNGALMHDVGVVVSFNSDSSELARRMNTEAAKAVRYGGMDPHEALKFVTRNPAVQLGIDHRTGSLEPGKDADFVIWSADPLSTRARCEQTWIEGARYFSLDDDALTRQRDAADRERLVAKILAAAHGDTGGDGDDVREGEGGGEDRPGGRRRRPPQEWIEQVARGEDPEAIRPGQCGCAHEAWHRALGGEQ